MTAADIILDRNRDYSILHDHTQMPDSPRLGAMIVTCVDWRVDPAHIARVRLGDALMIRTLGGRVTDAVASQVAAFSELLRLSGGTPLPEVVVIHHTECGTAQLIDPEFAARVAEGTATEAGTWMDIAVTDPFSTIGVDVAKLRSTPGIDPSTRLTGLVYNLETGTLDEVASD